MIIQKIKSQYKRWRFSKKINLQKKLRYFNQLYSSVNTTVNVEHQKSDIRLTFGEVDFFTFAALLSYLKPSTEDIFIDLGSGHGRACVIAALVYDIKNCIGIEILAERHAIAQKIYHQALPNLQEKLLFIHNDFLKQSIADATILFINATGFFNEDWALICAKFKTELKPNTQIIVSSKSLDNRYFEKTAKACIDMAYGPCHVSIYRKR